MSTHRKRRQLIALIGAGEGVFCRARRAHLARAKRRHKGYRWTIRKDKRGVLRCWRVS